MALLVGDSARRAREAIDAVAEALRDPPPDWHVTATLADGDAGLAVFYGYLHAATPDRDYDTLAARYLERAIDALAAEPIPAMLHHGYVGIAWATEHLIGRVIDADGEDLNAPIDDAVLAELAAPASATDYDLTGGIVGIGVYALERGPRDIAHAMLERIVARLDRLAERKPDGIAWPLPDEMFDADLRAQYPDGAYNLGLAHGSPAVIALLAACVARGVSPVVARELAEGAVAWLLARELPEHRFADFVRTGDNGVPSRLGWCYGELSIATALREAGRAMGRGDWLDHARVLAHAAAARPRETTGVVDACLCHGAAGLGAMFARAASVDHDPVLENAARTWFEAALDLRKVDPVGGFAPQVVDPGLAPGVASVGIVTGAEGVALALQSALDGSNPAWDRALMLSVAR